MYLVICYAIHYRDIVSVNTFDSWEQAMNFMLSDVSDTYKETKEDAANLENIECTIRDNRAQLSADDGDYILTWQVVEMPNQTKETHNAN